jgi:CrcB protein
MSQTSTGSPASRLNRTLSQAVPAWPVALPLGFELGWLSFFVVPNVTAKADFSAAVPGERRTLAPSMRTYLIVAAGGALGSVARYWLSGVIANRFGETFPWGTLLVNVSGCFAIGLLASLTVADGRWLAPSWFRPFALVGILGGYTTFSSFSLQTLTQVQDGDWAGAAGNVLGSVMLCLLGVWLGHVFGAQFNSPATT